MKDFKNEVMDFSVQMSIHHFNKQVYMYYILYFIYVDIILNLYGIHVKKMEVYNLALRNPIFDFTTSYAYYIAFITARWRHVIDS